MSVIINIYAMKINSITNNASVNIGESFHNSHTANTKSTGTNETSGDNAPSIAHMRNVYVDPDMNDQNEVGNADWVRANQI